MKSHRNTDVVDACASKEVQTRVTVSHEEIAALAFSYWQERGCQDGAAEDDWLRAERELTKPESQEL